MARDGRIRAGAEASGRDGRRPAMQDVIGDTLLLLEHPHVYTLGRGAAERYLVAPPRDVPIYRVSRGGQVTYHGPGQMIAYPILKLEGPARDVHAYLRALESVIIRTLRELRNRARSARERLTGAWVGSAQDRVDRRRHQALDHAAWVGAQRKHRPRFFRAHRALRYRRLPDDVDRWRGPARR